VGCAEAAAWAPVAKQDNGQRGARHHSQAGTFDHRTPHVIQAVPAADARCPEAKPAAMRKSAVLAHVGNTETQPKPATVQRVLQARNR